MADISQVRDISGKMAFFSVEHVSSFNLNVGWMPYVLKQILKLKILKKWSTSGRQVVVTKWIFSGFSILKHVLGV